MNTTGLLLAKALRRHGEDIVPLPGRTWEQSVTVINGAAILWYNTPDGSTHIVKDDAYSVDFVSAQFGMIDTAVILGFMTKQTALDLKNRIWQIWEEKA
jgi:hypothetical protein